MLEYYFTTGLKLLVLIFYLVIFFLTLNIKRKLDYKVTATLKFVIISFFFLITANILDILISIEIIPIVLNYAKDFLVFLFALFLLIAAVDFRRFVFDYLNCSHHKNQKVKKQKKLKNKKKRK